MIRRRCRTLDESIPTHGGAAELSLAYGTAAIALLLAAPGAYGAPATGHPGAGL